MIPTNLLIILLGQLVADDVSRSGTAADLSLDAERELVERIKAGDSDAFRQLYDASAPRVFRYVHMRVATPEIAEDITADVFVKAWKAFPKYKWQGKPVNAWLLRIAHNLVVDRYRRNRPTLTSILPWHSTGGEEQLRQIEDQDVIREAFNSLSYDEQMILYLHYFEGYNLNEVAEMIDKQPSAVRVAKFRALKRLGAKLDV